MTLRHDIKTRLGDSWTSPTWAILLPGGVGIDLTGGWTVRAEVHASRKTDTSLHTYTVDDGGVVLGTATVTLSDGTEVETSTVVLQHDDSIELPVFVGPWDCQIQKGTQTYTIAAGSYRTVAQVTP